LKLTSAKSRQRKFASNISPSSQATYTKEKKKTTTTTTLDLNRSKAPSFTHTKDHSDDDEHDSQNLKSSSIYINHHRHHHHHGGYEDCRHNNNNNNTLDFYIKPQASKQKRRSEYPVQIGKRKIKEKIRISDADRRENRRISRREDRNLPRG
jgi:hypothetical protein